MALDLTITGGPIFASRSRVNSDSRDFGTFAFSSMDSIGGRIVDGDPYSYWQDSNGSDASTETIELSFQTQSALVAKNIDFIALQNINWKRFKIEWKAGAGSYATIPEWDFTGTDNTATDLILELATLQPDHLKITITTTQAANDYKRLGGFYACENTLQLTTGNLEKYDKKFREMVRELKLGDGTKSFEYIRRSAASYEHFGASCELRFATQAERDALRSLKRAGTPFTFLPEPFDVPRDVFTGQFKGAWVDKYLSSYKGAGYTIGFNFEETGAL